LTRADDDGIVVVGGREGKAAVIDGLKVQMTSEELAGRLAERIRWHEQTALEYQHELEMPEDQRGDPETPEHILEHKVQQHREDAAVLTLIRDHLIPNEMYRLSELDLRFADLAPEFQMDYVLPRRPVQRIEGP
jgi:hypothetical protein